MTYYNEFDANAARWLRNLADAGLIRPGKVDDRDVREVIADEVRGYTRCHFFAGIGGWDHALALAGWPAARPVWTASCPCQPFSTAGKGEGEADERHLWPVVSALVRQCRPDCLFGEQVASAAGYEWLDGVRADLEAEGYAFGAADLPACCAGAPHVRQRLFWVATLGNAAHAQGDRLHGQRRIPRGSDGARRPRDNQQPRDGGTLGDPSDADRAGLRERGGAVAVGAQLATAFGGGEAGHLSDAVRVRRDGRTPDQGRGAVQRMPAAGASQDGHSALSRGFWDAYDVLDYRDGKRRRVEPGTFPLAHGVSKRLVKLRGYGNAIVPQVAAMFVRAFLDSE